MTLHHDEIDGRVAHAAAVEQTEWINRLIEEDPA
jgi:hypothetical protein